MKDQILAWLNSVDDSIEQLSKHYEGKITGLQRWVLSRRHIVIYTIPAKNFHIVRIEPREAYSKDLVHEMPINSDSDIQQAFAPFNSNLTVRRAPSARFCIFMGDMRVTQEGDPFALPVLEFPGLIIQITDDLVKTELSVEKARHHAMSLWNSAVCGSDSGMSFTEYARITFIRMSELVKRKAFLERRIHRFINAHRKILLPEHRKCFFEQQLVNNEERRVADFILDQREGFPPLLIELENPAHALFLNSGKLSKEANAAKSQIAEWCQYIEQDQRNISGEMAFLAGPKQRLVVIGRGTQHRQEMVNTKFTDTIMWTYEFMIEQAKERWNNILREQARILGLSYIPSLQ